MQVQNAAQPNCNLEALEDSQLVEMVRRHSGPAFRVIMQRYNRRLYRVARAIVKNDSEAEDVVQAAYVNAYASLGTFRGDANLATWLTRIAFNEALGRLRRQRPMVELEVLDAEWSGGQRMNALSPMTQNDPEQAAAQGQIRVLIERAVDDLPENFRLVFVLRDVEDLSVEETAGLLSVPAATVKTRLHRARRQLRQALDAQLASALTGAFPFDGARCQSTADKVLAQLGLGPSSLAASDRPNA